MLQARKEISRRCSAHGASFIKGTKAQVTLSGSSPLGPGNRSWINILDVEQGRHQLCSLNAKKEPSSRGERSHPYPSPGWRLPSPSVEQEGFGLHVLVVIQQGRRVDCHRKQKEEETAMLFSRAQSCGFWQVGGVAQGRSLGFHSLWICWGVPSISKEPREQLGKATNTEQSGNPAPSLCSLNSHPGNYGAELTWTELRVFSWQVSISLGFQKGHTAQSITPTWARTFSTGTLGARSGRSFLLFHRGASGTIPVLGLDYTK